MGNSVVLLFINVQLTFLCLFPLFLYQVIGMKLSYRTLASICRTLVYENSAQALLRNPLLLKNYLLCIWGERWINTQNLIILSMSLYYICLIRMIKLKTKVWLYCLIKNPINVIPCIRSLTIILLWSQFKFHQLQFCPF